MARSSARLHVVGADDPAAPEQLLVDLFACEAELNRLALVNRQQLESARLSYARANDLKALPRMELLRTRYTPAARP